MTDQMKEFIDGLSDVDGIQPDMADRVKTVKRLSDMAIDLLAETEGLLGLTDFMLMLAGFAQGRVEKHGG